VFVEDGYDVEVFTASDTKIVSYSSVMMVAQKTTLQAITTFRDTDTEVTLGEA
jgi:hypothetical protein